MNGSKYGQLLTDSIRIHRGYFNEMVRLLGINCIYRAPKSNKYYTTYAEIESNYECPILVGCIFDEHPNQRTLTKIGWVSELQETSSLISVPYDLYGIQNSALFIVPSGIDSAKGRLFRVVKISNIMVYPCSLTCEIVPEYENTFEHSLLNHKTDSFNLLNGEDDTL